jgi:hypothetical protein
MLVSLRILAWIYVLTGAVAAAKYLYAIFFGGPGDGFGNAILALLLGYGLLHHNSLARSVALFLSILGLIGGAIGLVLCVGHFMGYSTAAGGLIVDQPLLAFALLGLLIAFTAAQVWVLTRPQVAALFKKSAT